MLCDPLHLLLLQSKKGFCIINKGVKQVQKKENSNLGGHTSTIIHVWSVKVEWKTCGKQPRCRSMFTLVVNTWGEGWGICLHLLNNEVHKMYLSDLIWWQWWRLCDWNLVDSLLEKPSTESRLSLLLGFNPGPSQIPNTPSQIPKTPSQQIIVPTITPNTGPKYQKHSHGIEY